MKLCAPDTLERDREADEGPLAERVARDVMAVLNYGA